MSSVIIAGDLAPQHRVLKYIEEENYSYIFDGIKHIVEAADYSIVNLEAPIIVDEKTPIIKNGPNLYAPKKTIDALSYAGFKCVSLANNHFLDQGNNGVINTLNACLEKKIDYLGAGNNLLEASKTLFKTIDGDIYAFINCCEHEYSIATEESPGCNPINPIQQFYAITEAKKIARYVIVIVHGGFEYCQLPTLRMVEWYRFFIDVGADVVVNHHQHCFSGYESYNGKLIFYGLGNFCFDRINNQNELWTTGYMVKLFFKDTDISFQLIPYLQCGNKPNVELMESDYLSSKINSINHIIADKKLLSDTLDKYMKMNDMGYDMLFMPYNNRYLKALYRQKLLPNFFSNYKLSRIRDLLLCESHNERFKHYILDLYNKKFLE